MSAGINVWGCSASGLGNVKYTRERFILWPLFSTKCSQRVTAKDTEESSVAAPSSSLKLRGYFFSSSSVSGVLSAQGGSGSRLICLLFCFLTCQLLRTFSPQWENYERDEKAARSFFFPPSHHTRGIWLEVVVF